MITKPIGLLNGVVVSYWRPVKSDLNHEAQTLNVRVAGWLDKAAYLAGLAPVVPSKLYSFGPEQIAACPETAALSLTMPVVALLRTTTDFGPEPEAEPEADPT